MTSVRQWDLPDERICEVVKYGEREFRVLSLRGKQLRWRRFGYATGFDAPVTLVDDFENHWTDNACPAFARTVAGAWFVAYTPGIDTNGRRELPTAELVRIDKQGAIKLRQPLRPADTRLHVNDLLLWRDGHVLVAGSQWRDSVQTWADAELWLGELDAAGILLSQHDGWPPYNGARELVPGADGSLIFQAREWGIDSHLVTMLSMDPDGNVSWEIPHGDNYSGGYDHLVPDAKGGAGLLGRRRDWIVPDDAESYTEFSLLASRVSVAGNVVWEATTPLPAGSEAGFGRSDATMFNGELLVYAVTPTSFDAEALPLPHDAVAMGTFNVDDGSACTELLQRVERFDHVRLVGGSSELFLAVTRLDSSGRESSTLEQLVFASP